MRLTRLAMMVRSLRFDPVALKALACERAIAQGAAAVRVTDALEDGATRQRLQASFERGDLATWRYDDAYAVRASDPRTLLADARSIICLAVAFATPPPQARPLTGRVSNYAWSEDYHRRVRALLENVAAIIDEAAGKSVTAIACDTKPLAERALAARAGLGWIGKHTNLIAPGSGSFVFLGEIVTSIALPPDAPLSKTCGSCTRCVGACPTGALRGDYTMDATLCISDLTQRTGGIPRALRPLIGTWVWGCDMCQEACPPTRRAPFAMDAKNEPASSEVAQPSLLGLLCLKSRDYDRFYRRTGMGWRGAAVLRRNAAVALGNALDRSAVAGLVRALVADPHPMVRSHAAWALGRIGAPGALDALTARRHAEPDADVCEEIDAALEPFAATAR
ncbi:MAG TPA: tRNA epoxyqueuosine(34) reductase QueG [Verrucomicrobiae bacterium]|nr:tRNA epoxyqueuosine(34) reductase QueG [Verrucomicrobiae bacterium]